MGTSRPFPKEKRDKTVGGGEHYGELSVVVVS